MVRPQESQLFQPIGGVCTRMLGSWRDEEAVATTAKNPKRIGRRIFAVPLRIAVVQKVKEVSR
jgi:hypothetical protein